MGPVGLVLQDAVGLVRGCATCRFCLAAQHLNDLQRVPQQQQRLVCQRGGSAPLVLLRREHAS